MKEHIHDSEIGEIMYEESIWTGKKSIYINGKLLEKLNKTTFLMKDGEEKTHVFLKGNLLTGITIRIDQREIVVSRQPKWYEIALAILPFVINIVWGNNVVLFSIIPIVGGAIGGGICGAMSLMSMLLMKKANEIWKKLLIGIGMLAGSFLICFAIAMLILIV